MKITHTIDPESQRDVLKRNYINFSASEISNNLLFGTIHFVDDKKKNTLSFEAELLKFFIDIYDALIRIESRRSKNESIFSMYQNYFFNLELEKEYIVLTYNKNLVLRYDYSNFMSEIKGNMRKLYLDFKILFNEYQSIKNIGFLIDKFESLK
jgi:hypothetical protein